MTGHEETDSVTLEQLATAVAKALNRPIVPVRNEHLDSATTDRFRVLRLRDSGSYGEAGDLVAWLDGGWQNLSTEATANVPELQTDGQSINNPSDSLFQGPLTLRHETDEGTVMVAQTANDSGPLSERKIKFYFFNDDGSTRLAEFSPAEVKPDGETVEWSHYIRDSPISNGGGGSEKWLNVTTTDNGPGTSENFWPVVDFQSLHRLDFRGPEDGDVTVGYRPGYQSDGNSVFHNWMAPNAANDGHEQWLEERLWPSDESIRWTDTAGINGNDGRIWRYRFNHGTWYWDKTVEFNGGVRGTLDVGAQPSASDLEENELAFTSDRDGNGTPAWLYHDGTNAHYWDADGTL